MTQVSSKKFASFAGVYRRLLQDVMHRPDFISSPRGMEIKERLNYSFTITNPMNNLYKNPVRSVNLRYLAGEMIWYFSGDNSVRFISDYSKFWNNIANEDGSCNSAYGNLIFREPSSNYSEKAEIEWRWAYNMLVRDRDTRQALIHFNKPWHMNYKTKDFPCTMYGIFHIRNSNSLYFSVHMRSSDSIKGTCFDVPFFLLLHQQMWKLLRDSAYPELRLGEFSYTSNSQHIYEKDFELVGNMLKEPFKNHRMPPISNDLVMPSGVPSEEIYLIRNNIKKIKTLTFRDPLLNFICKNAAS